MLFDAFTFACLSTLTDFTVSVETLFTSEALFKFAKFLSPDSETISDFTEPAFLISAIVLTIFFVVLFTSAFGELASVLESSSLFSAENFTLLVVASILLFSI